MFKFKITFLFTSSLCLNESNCCCFFGPGQQSKTGDVKFTVDEKFLVDKMGINKDDIIFSKEGFNISEANDCRNSFFNVLSEIGFDKKVFNSIYLNSYIPDEMRDFFLNSVVFLSAKLIGDINKNYKVVFSLYVVRSNTDIFETLLRRNISNFRLIDKNSGNKKLLEDACSNGNDEILLCYQFPGFLECFYPVIRIDFTDYLNKAAAILVPKK